MKAYFRSIFYILSSMGLIISIPAYSKTSKISNFYKNKCAHSFGGERVCSISFQRLYVNPVFFSGKKLFLSGYLAIHDGELLLYSDKIAYDHDMQDSSIVVRVNLKSRIKIAKKWAYKYIYISGVFKMSSGDDDFLGELISVDYILNFGSRIYKESPSNLKYQIQQKSDGSSH